MSTHSVDALITQVESDIINTPPADDKTAAPTPKETPAVETPAADKVQDDPYEAGNEKPADDQESSSGEPVDEYGNEVPKSRTYTEDEVNKLIQDRLARSRNTQPEQQPNANQPDAKDFKYDAESEQTWEQQLESFVEKTIQKVSNKQTETQWKQQEETRQREFEDKFTTGVGKYTDFESVVRGKSITPSMMMATRGMENPAAFVYAAAKNHPLELDRIAKINDPYSQALEIGKLEEKMRKSKPTTRAPKPISNPTGDIPNDKGGKRSIDDLIRIDEKKEFNRRRGLK